MQYGEYLPRGLLLLLGAVAQLDLQLKVVYARVAHREARHGAREDDRDL